MTLVQIKSHNINVPECPVLFMLHKHKAFKGKEAFITVTQQSILVVLSTCSVLAFACCAWALLQWHIQLPKLLPAKQPVSQKFYSRWGPPNPFDSKFAKAPEQCILLHHRSSIVEREVAGLHVHDVKLIHMQHRLSFQSTFAPTLEHEYARQGDLLLVLLRRAQLGGETPTNTQRSPRSAKSLRCH